MLNIYRYYSHDACTCTLFLHRIQKAILPSCHYFTDEGAIPHQTQIDMVTDCLKQHPSLIAAMFQLD